MDKFHSEISKIRGNFVVSYGQIMRNLVLGGTHYKFIKLQWHDPSIKCRDAGNLIDITLAYIFNKQSSYEAKQLRLKQFINVTKRPSSSSLLAEIGWTTILIRAFQEPINSNAHSICKFVAKGMAIDKNSWHHWSVSSIVKWTTKIWFVWSTFDTFGHYLIRL